MRFVLFYSGVESFNYFTNQIKLELEKAGHETFILNLSNPTEDNHSLTALSAFITKGIDAVISFDGLGIKEPDYIALWDSLNVPAMNILMDHPLRFHPTMMRHPKLYVQFCCDRNHVIYSDMYFGDTVLNVDFMPHAGTYNGPLDLSDYEARPYDVLFSGTYYAPHSYLDQIDKEFENNKTLRDFYHDLADYMIKNHTLTTEQSVLDMIKISGIQVSDEGVKTMIACAEPIDWLARMHFRGSIVNMLVDSGINVYLLGRGWENHPSFAKNMPNMNIVSDRVPFADSLEIMSKAKINLNVMPWFKDGTHDRVFNILLRGSLPLTDDSIWLRENFNDKENIVFYSLDKTDEIPSKINHYLESPDGAKAVIAAGYDLVKNNFTFEQITDQILSYFE